MKSVVVSIAAGWGVAPPVAPVLRTPHVPGPVAAPPALRRAASAPASSAYLAALCAFGAGILSFGMNGASRQATLAVMPEEKEAVVGKQLELPEETAGIVERYLEKKYELAASGGGKVASESEPTATTLRSAFSDLLPPLPEGVFQQELDKVMKPLPKGKVQLEEFKACALGNPDWSMAGALTVCEVIYIDSLANYYTNGRVILNDEDYNDLKEYLYGEGLSLPQLSMDEAKFVTAVYRYHRGDVIMEEPVYAALKKKLQDAGSWVVKREKTPNEQAGLRSFMYYLHLGMTADAENWEIPTSLRVVQSGGAFLGTKGQKGLPAEIKEEDPGFSLEEWFQVQFKNKTFLMETKSPFWYSVIPEEKRKLGKGRKVKEGPFSWLCYLGSFVLGETTFNKIRGKLIAAHSQIITKFVANMELSAKTRGNLIKLAKKNGDELGFLVGE